MDYKELINRMRYNNRVSPDDIADAAAAIETLLAERDTALEGLKGRCTECKHWRVCFFDEQHKIGCVNSNKGHWQWRGVQKGCKGESVN